MDEAIRFAPAILSVVGGLIVLLFGLIMRHLFKSNGLLFAHIGRLEKKITVLELIAVKNEPDSTVLLRALTAPGSPHP